MAIRIGILTVSDRSSRGERADTSGPTLAKAVNEQGWLVVHSAVIPDELESIKNTLLTWAVKDDLDLILTTGGTGFSPRDVTPEATRAIIEREAPGIAEAMRYESLRITPHAMLSRAVAGIRGHTLIVNLPGSPKGALENLAVLIPVIHHAVQLLRDEPAAEQGHHAI